MGSRFGGRSDSSEVASGVCRLLLEPGYVGDVLWAGGHPLVADELTAAHDRYAQCPVLDAHAAGPGLVESHAVDHRRHIDPAGSDTDLNDSDHGVQIPLRQVVQGAPRRQSARYTRWALSMVERIGHPANPNWGVTLPRAEKIARPQGRRALSTSRGHQGAQR